MLSIAHSAKRVSINVMTFVALIIFTTVLCPALAKASNIEPLNDCSVAQVYTFSCQQTGNYFDSTEALQSTVTAVAGLDHVQLDAIGANLSTSTLLSGVSMTGSSGAVTDVNQNDSPGRLPEPPSLTLMCIGLVAGLGIHLRKTTSRNTQPEPAL